MKTTIDAMKPLQWSDERKPCDKCHYNHVVADSGLGRISIEWKGWKDNDSHTVYVAGEHVGDSNTLEEAKQLAGQHLLNVVLSLIEDREEAQTVAVPSGEREALIGILRNLASVHGVLTGSSLTEAADMLAADAQLLRAPIPSAIGDQLERTDWTQKEALEFYAAGKHYDIPQGRTRILDTGAIASSALKSINLEYATKHGDVTLLAADAQQVAAISKTETTQALQQALDAMSPMRGMIIFDQAMAAIQRVLSAPQPLQGDKP